MPHLQKALGDKAGIRRYGSASVPMDDALANAAIDLSGRRPAFRIAAAEAGGEADPEAILMAMGLAYYRLLEDRTLLLMQMQAYAACDDPEVREVVREEFLRLVRFVQSASGAPDTAVREWLAQGMLMNVSAAMDLSDVDADWARMCLGDMTSMEMIHAHKGGGA